MNFRSFASEVDADLVQKALQDKVAVVAKKSLKVIKDISSLVANKINMHFALMFLNRIQELWTIYAIFDK